MLADNPPHHPGSDEAGGKHHGDLQRWVELVDSRLELSEYLAHVELARVDRPELVDHLEEVEGAELADDAGGALPDVVDFSTGFGQPDDMVVGLDGSLYVADATNQQVIKIVTNLQPSP